MDLTGALLSEFSLFGCQLDFAVFERARFTGMALFGGTQFISKALFEGAQFTGIAVFGHAQFTGDAIFRGAQFTYDAFFRGAQFTGATFQDAQFSGTTFQDAQCTGKPSFKGARVASAAEPGSVWPPGWTTRPAQSDNGEDPAFLYLARVEDGNPPDA